MLLDPSSSEPSSISNIKPVAPPVDDTESPPQELWRSWSGLLSDSRVLLFKGVAYAAADILSQDDEEWFEARDVEPEGYLLGAAAVGRFDEACRAP